MQGILSNASMKYDHSDINESFALPGKFSLAQIYRKFVYFISLINIFDSKCHNQLLRSCGCKSNAGDLRNKYRGRTLSKSIFFHLDLRAKVKKFFNVIFLNLYEHVEAKKVFQFN